MECWSGIKWRTKRLSLYINKSSGCDNVQNFLPWSLFTGSMVETRWQWVLLQRSILRIATAMALNLVVILSKKNGFFILYHSWRFAYSFLWRPPCTSFRWLPPFFGVHLSESLQHAATGPLAWYPVDSSEDRALNTTEKFLLLGSLESSLVCRLRWSHLVVSDGSRLC